MFEGFRDTFKIPDLKRRIGITILLLTVYRFGCYIPVPGINGKELAKIFEGSGNTLFALADLFSGGALSQATIFALGIMPYISVSIVLELLASIVPYFENMLRSGVEGRRKLTQLTRIGTVGLCIFQGMAVSILLENPEHFGGVVIVANPGWLFRVVTTLTLTAGTVFLMYLGEQITEKGIGNGISLIITTSIISRMPVAFHRMAGLVVSGEVNFLVVIILCALIFGVVAAAIIVNESERRIPIQYAKRVIGKRIYGGQATYLPIKLNQGGVLPLIFAIAILTFPATILSFTENKFLIKMATILNPEGIWGMILYAGLTIFFCYFYAGIIFNPDNIAEDLQKYGGFIQGIRPGKSTALYLERIVNRLTLPGSLMLAGIALFPYIIRHIYKKIPYIVANIFGGIGLLIVVSVLIETIRQIEAHLLLRHYEGFIKKGKIK
ncbi:MAG: preprotein translocase subunit SecY [candidate division WOR-3 bacterium]|nr:preprotein translocase subunit SecY [Candidatus Omnitrophota bacterium]MCM8807255.1 preprotein translocase subunit SecY [Candidatus Omnitrophota bacterium]